MLLFRLDLILTSRSAVAHCYKGTMSDVHFYAALVCKWDDNILKFLSLHMKKKKKSLNT